MNSLRDKYTEETTVCNDLNRKIDFLEEYYESFEKKPKSFINSVELIEKIGEYEQIYHRDFAEFKYNELSFAFTSLSWTGVAGTFGVKSSFFKKYVTWCHDNGYINDEQFKSHPIFSYKFEDGKNVVRFKRENFRDFDDFYEYLEVVLDEDDGGSDTDSSKCLIQKTFLYLLWSGMETDEIRSLTINDVDLRKKKILLKSKNIYVSIPDKRIVDAIKHTMEITKLKVAGKGKSMYYKTIKESDMVIKNTQMKEGKVSVRFCSAIVGQLKKLSLELPSTHKFYGKAPTSCSISRNGLFCRLYQEELKLGRRITVYDEEIISRAMYSAVANNTRSYLLSNYENWKELRDTLE